MPPGQDRWTATSSGVVVLDGASAVDPTAPGADVYVDVLLAALAARLEAVVTLPSAIHDAIAETAERLRLEPGRSPSSTLLMLREKEEWLELAVLGDSTALVGFGDGRTELLTDARMAAIAAPEREQYRRRLVEGCGYDQVHRDLLAQIRRAEPEARNVVGGYWIAEAVPAAAEHALVRRYRAEDVAWCVLATDGAQRGLDHHGVDWAGLLHDTDDALRRRLDDVHRWERDQDPDGAQLPRSKRHDDKTIVTWSAGPTTGPARTIRAAAR